MRSTSAQPIQRTNVYEIVADRLLRDISEGRLVPGEALPTERELTQHFGVGRSSVREALRLLESHGAIQGRGQGQFVVGSQTEVMVPGLTMLMSLGHANRIEVHELRRALEVEIAGLAAERRTAEDIDAIRRANRLMRDSMPAPEATLTADLEFHAAVAEASHNRAMVSVATAVRTVLHRAQGRYYVAST